MNKSLILIREQVWSQIVCYFQKLQDDLCENSTKYICNYSRMKMVKASRLSHKRISMQSQVIVFVELWHCCLHETKKNEDVTFFLISCFGRWNKFLLSIGGAAVEWQVNRKTEFTAKWVAPLLFSLIRFVGNPRINTPKSAMQLIVHNKQRAETWCMMPQQINWLKEIWFARELEI